MKANGTGLRRVYSKKRWPVGGNGADWAPDGTRIAYVGSSRGKSAIVIEGLNGKRRRVVYRGPVDIGSSADEPGVRWSPDGKQIAFEGRSELRILNLSTRSVRVLPRGGLTEVDGPANWSPDSKQLVFTGMDESGPPPAIKGVYVMNADGSGLRQVVPVLSYVTGSVFPAWSPDGKQIAFTHQLVDDNGNFAGYQIGVVNADGSGLHDILHGKAATKGALYCYGNGAWCTVNYQVDWQSRHG
jgi:Tol biopolymer transport system component